MEKSILSEKKIHGNVNFVWEKSPWKYAGDWRRDFISPLPRHVMYKRCNPKKFSFCFTNSGEVFQLLRFSFLPFQHFFVPDTSFNIIQRLTYTSYSSLQTCVCWCWRSGSVPRPTTGRCVTQYLSLQPAAAGNIQKYTSERKIRGTSNTGLGL